MQGFTLMEMVVAMTIMLMLIALVVSSMNPWGVLNKGQDATRKKDLKRLLQEKKRLTQDLRILSVKKEIF